MNFWHVFSLTKNKNKKAFVWNFIQGYFPTIILLVIYTPWTLSKTKPRRDSCIALNERPVGFPELVRVEEEQRHKPLAAGYEGECRRIPGACSASTSSTVSHSFFPWGFTSEALTRLFLKWLRPARQDLGEVNEGSVRTAEPLFKDTPRTPPPQPRKVGLKREVDTGVSCPWSRGHSRGNSKEKASGRKQILKEGYSHENTKEFLFNSLEKRGIIHMKVQRKRFQK